MKNIHSGTNQKLQGELDSSKTPFYSNNNKWKLFFINPIVHEKSTETQISHRNYSETFIQFDTPKKIRWWLLLLKYYNLSIH